MLPINLKFPTTSLYFPKITLPTTYHKYNKSSSPRSRMFFLFFFFFSFCITLLQKKPLSQHHFTHNKNNIITKCLKSLISSCPDYKNKRLYIYTLSPPSLKEMSDI
eukprot:UN01354